MILAFGTVPEVYHGTIWNSTEAGQYGDFVGGIFGTVLFLISLALLYINYRHQKDHNDSSAIQQAEQHARESFESRFFQLLQYQRDNTEELDLGAIRGRRCFVYIFREWRLLHTLVGNAAQKCGVNLDSGAQCALAYIALFNGSGPNGRNLLRDTARDEGFAHNLVEQVILYMGQDWKTYKEAQDIPQSSLSVRAFSFGITNDVDQIRPLPYTPFGGHHSRLAHYYRHLFHIVKYADLHAPGGAAADYVDLVRAQLTTAEQALLALHGYSIRSPWSRGGYIEKYHFIKNIPSGFFVNEKFDFHRFYPGVVFSDHKGGSQSLRTKLAAAHAESSSTILSNDEATLPGGNGFRLQPSDNGAS